MAHDSGPLSIALIIIIFKFRFLSVDFKEKSLLCLNMPQSRF